MFISKKKLKNIINRLDQLEANEKAETWHHGTVTLKDLAKMVDTLPVKKKPPAATDGSERIAVTLDGKEISKAAY